MKPLHLAAGLLVAFLWGIQVVAVKVGEEQLPPLLMVGIRFVAMAILLVPFVPRPRADQWGPIALISLFSGTLHFGVMYVGIKMIDASTAAIAYQLTTPFAVLVAWLWLGDRIDLFGMGGIGLAFAGVVVLAGGPHMAGDNLGIALVAFAALSFAIGTSLTKRLGAFHPLGLNAWSAVFTAPLILLASALLEHGQLAAIRSADWITWLAVLHTVVSGGIIGFGIWFWLLQIYPVSRVAPFTLLAPLFAIAASVVALGEKLTWPIVIGGALTLIGVAVVQVAQRRRMAMAGDVAPVTATPLPEPRASV